MNKKTIKTLSVLATAGVLALGSDAMASSRTGGDGSSGRIRGSAPGQAAGNAAMNAQAQVDAVINSLNIKGGPREADIKLIAANMANPAIARFMSTLSKVSGQNALQKRAALAGVAALGSLLQRSAATVGETTDLSPNALKNASGEVKAVGALLLLADYAVNNATAEPKFVEGQLVKLLEGASTQLNDNKPVSAAMNEANKALGLDGFSSIDKVIESCQPKA